MYNLDAIFAFLVQKDFWIWRYFFDLKRALRPLSFAPML
jgi:hypothetical protein